MEPCPRDRGGRRRRPRLQLNLKSLLTFDKYSEAKALSHGGEAVSSHVFCMGVGAPFRLLSGPESGFLRSCSLEKAPTTKSSGEGLAGDWALAVRYIRVAGSTVLISEL